MGWKLKGFLVIVGFVLLGTGLWFLALPLFAYLVYDVLPGRGRRSAEGGVTRRILMTGQGGGMSEDGTIASAVSRRRGAGLGWHWRYLVGALFLLSALVALGAHGTYSPIVLGGLGLLCTFWGLLKRMVVGAAGGMGGGGGLFSPTAFSPVRESILLTSGRMPFLWAAVVEVKFSSQEATRALAVLRDNLIVTSQGSEKPGAFLEIKVVAPSYHSAESRVIERLRGMAALLAGRGAYLLPLDSQEVVERFQRPMEPVQLELDESIVAMIGHSHYDLLVIKPTGSHARSVGAYTRVRHGNGLEEEEFEAMLAAGTGDAGSAVTSWRSPTQGGKRATLPLPRQRFHREPLLWEVVSSLQERVRFSDPDSYTTLLNNMHVSRNVPLPQKLSMTNGTAGSSSSGSSNSGSSNSGSSNSGSSSGHDNGAVGVEEGGVAHMAASAPGRAFVNGAMLMVESLGGTPVQLSRTQLRAIVKIYA
jgi:hypothetical protein